MIRIFIWNLWGWGREVILSTMVLPTAVSAAKAAYADNSLHEDTILVLWTRRQEHQGKKTNICCGRGCFQCGLEPLNDSRGQFPERPRGTNTSSFTKDKPFWRGPRPCALTVNTTVSATNVTCDWWETSCIEGQEGDHRGRLWKRSKQLRSGFAQKHRHARTHACTHVTEPAHTCMHASKRARCKSNKRPG